MVVTGGAGAPPPNKFKNCELNQVGRRYAVVVVGRLPGWIAGPQDSCEFWYMAKPHLDNFEYLWNEGWAMAKSSKEYHSDPWRCHNQAKPIKMTFKNSFDVIRISQ